LPSPPAEVLTEADARRQFVGLLIPVNRALRVIWIQTHGQHSLPQLDDAPAVEGYERCAEPLLRRELYNFDQLKGVMQYNGDTTPLLESLFRFFSDLRDFFNAWVDYRISTFGAEAAGTLDGVLNASGAYYLADAVLHWRHNYPYLAGGLNGESLRIEWASRAGVFVDVTEWGSQRAQSADILWGIVEQLGGEDVRTSAVFQNSSRAADAVTSIATFFLDVRGVYNLVRGAGGAVGTATRIGTLPPGAVVGGGAAALAPYLARVAVVADEVPWATAAGAVSAIRAAILAFSAGGDGGNEEILSHSASFPENESQLRHIFAEREGHVIDTLENRTMIQNTVAEANYLGPDQYGNHWYAQIQSDGTQIWVRVRNGRIINAGVNQVPKSYHPETGLNAPLNW
ncbi:MAG: hypothetical protein SF162_13390, partial [bacterium]|nr:hypothetical protein [bacterium]